MRTETVLLERSFLAALADVNSEHHRVADDVYRSFLGDFEQERIRLVALSRDLAEPWRRRRRGLLAAVASLPVAAQHRRTARRMSTGAPVQAVDLDVATTLVMLRRHRVRTIATFDERFRAYDLDVIPPAPTADDEPAGPLSGEPFGPHDSN